MIFDKTAFVSALQLNNPVSDQEVFVTYSGFRLNGITTAAVKMNVQPASPELTAMAEGQMFKTYKAFTTASGITETMLLTISGSNEVYKVRGREAFAYGMGQHYELTLEKSSVQIP
jgi:hypothetical protein